MAASEIKEYLDCVSIRKINELDTALIESYGTEKQLEHSNMVYNEYLNSDLMEDS